jgi:transcription termination/antitermination protein NusG
MTMQDPEEDRLEDETVDSTEELVEASQQAGSNDTEAAESEQTAGTEESSDAPVSDDSEISEPEQTPASEVEADGSVALIAEPAASEAEESASAEEPGQTPVAKETVEESTELPSDPEASVDLAPTEESEQSSVAKETAGESAEPDAEPAVSEQEPISEQPVDEVLEAKPKSASKKKKTASDRSERESEAGEAETPDSILMSVPFEEEGGTAWFVIHCYSGYENKVRHNLEQRIETMGMKDMIFDVVVPTQEEIEVRDGKRRTVERHIFPGYVLVNMVLTEESWYVVRNTPGVTGFVGMGNNPTPLRPEEVAQIVKRMEADAPTVKVTFKVGERVRIVDGPFNDFRGMVAEIDMERTKVRVMVSFFGRETPVELDFLQVEKA